MRRACLRNSIDVCLCIDIPATCDAVQGAHALMHYRVNERFRAVSMTFGSEYIKGRVLDTLEMAGWQQIELLLNSARNAGMLGKSLAKAICGAILLE